MARSKLPLEKLAAAEHLFMSGLGIREVAAQVGIGQRQCANAAKKGNWNALRQQRGIPAVTQRAEAIEVVQNAARTHVAAVESRWRARLSGIIETVAETSERISGLLAREKFEDATALELTTMLRGQSEVLARIDGVLNPKSGPTMNVQINAGDSIQVVAATMSASEALAVYQANLRGGAGALPVFQSSENSA